MSTMTPTTPTMPDELLTGPQAQKFAKISRHTLREWRLRGLRFIGSGKQMRYTKSDLMAYIASTGKKVTE